MIDRRGPLSGHATTHDSVTAPSRPDSFVRTVALFDLGRTDTDNDPLIIGKPDLHLTGDDANGTFWL